MDNYDNYYMVSFDIEKLYFNIPLCETVKTFLSTLFNQLNDIVMGNIVQTMLELSVCNSFIILNNKLY